MKRRVLIVCTGNSCRSQMAEGYWRHYGGDAWEVFSAGLRPIGVHPLAISAMAENGIDISEQQSQAVDEFTDQPFDLVVTVCSNADANCPTLAGAKHKQHWPFDDPYFAAGDDEQIMSEFRRVRDQIGEKIAGWLRENRE